mmetsp:Transcript_25327/g.80509  ORF Transcript_25327/g.80509 Transcript_25327/m.80509 type:complete len:234 (+) Transcript_25327:348-1049(+)
MPFFRAPISSSSVAIEPSRSWMAASALDTAVSKPFFLSSDASSCTAQYSFLVSSSFCSALSVTTIWSIILITFSNPTCFPPKASSRRPIRGSDGRPPRLEGCTATVRSTESALDRRVAALACIWTKLALGLGSVFLKISSASSSFKALMVSARATSSSARVALISSHSLVLVSQLVPSSARNWVSSLRDSFVSSRSPCMPAISTPSSPTRFVSSSICSVRRATSFVFAATNAS